MAQLLFRGVVRCFEINSYSAVLYSAASETKKNVVLIFAETVDVVFIWSLPVLNFVDVVDVVDSDITGQALGFEKLFSIHLKQPSWNDHGSWTFSDLLTC